jgi:hypothetical protein
MYASSDSAALNTGHRRLSEHFTSHLNDGDLIYFRKWDRLIDLERHASSKDTAIKSWLLRSGEKEAIDGNCISSLLLDKSSITTHIGSKTALEPREERTTLRFSRATNSVGLTSINCLGFECGNYVLLSTDSPFLTPRRETTHKMHILKGFVVSIGEQEIEVSVAKRDINHIKRLCEAINTGLTFRLDKDEFSSSTGILYQNLVNFLTLGKWIGRFCTLFVQYNNPSSFYLTPHR